MVMLSSSSLSQYHTGYRGVMGEAILVSRPKRALGIVYALAL
jgi:hypothetical protein